MRRNCWSNPNINLERVGKGTRAFPFLHYASYFRASWAAVRYSVQARLRSLFCHSGLRAGILGGLCVVLCCASVIAIGDAARNVPTIRAAVPSRPFAQPSHPHHVIRLRANWAAVRPSVQAHPSRHSGLDPESWAACAWYCAVPVSSLSETLHATSLPSAPAASQGPVSVHGVTAHCAAVPSRSLHSRLFFPPLSFRPPSRNPGWLVRGVVLCRCHRYRRRCTQRLYHPRLPPPKTPCLRIAPLYREWKPRKNNPPRRECFRAGRV